MQTTLSRRKPSWRSTCKAFADRLLAFGTRGLSESEARQVNVATLGTVAALAVSPFFTLQALLNGFPFFSLVSLVTFTVIPACLAPYVALASLGHVRLAKVAYSLGMNCIALAYAWAYGAGAGLYLYASALGLGPFFLFGRAERARLIFFVVLPVPLFALATTVFESPVSAIPIPPDVLRQVWMLNFVSSFLIVACVFAVTFLMVRRTEDRLAAFSAVVSEYLDGSLVERLRDGVDVSPSIRHLTVFFTDLVGSTRLSFEMGKERFGHMIHEYVREMQRIIKARGGYIEDVSGDGILGYVGNFASNGPERDATEVVEMCLEMRLRLTELLPRFRELYGLPNDLCVRIGVSSGEAAVGKVSGARALYTANGDVVNLGAKLEDKVRDIAPSGGILISHTTARLVGDRFPLTAHELDVDGLRIKAFLVGEGRQPTNTTAGAQNA